MANIWFRMYAEFATDPKVQMMSETNQRRLTMLFCLRCNDHVTLHDEEVTFLLRISNEEWKVTKRIFIDKGFIDNDNNLLNWERRQFVSDSSSARVAKHRANKKNNVTTCNVTVTPQNRNITDSEQTQIKEHYCVDSAREDKQIVSQKKDSAGNGATVWVEYFVNIKGFAIHEAQTAKTVPMYLDWVKRGVTIADVELAMIAAHRYFNADKAVSPTGYKKFVNSVMEEKQKSQNETGQVNGSGSFQKPGQFTTKTAQNIAASLEWLAESNL